METNELKKKTFENVCGGICSSFFIFVLFYLFRLCTNNSSYYNGPKCVYLLEVASDYDGFLFNCIVLNLVFLLIVLLIRFFGTCYSIFTAVFGLFTVLYMLFFYFYYLVEISSNYYRGEDCGTLSTLCYWWLFFNYLNLTVIPICACCAICLLKII
jgi:hypothetical protein